MKHLLSIFFLLAVFAVPSTAVAQQSSETASGSLLQSGGTGLQQTPAGLQGSAPQIFGSTTTVLEQPNQKLLNGLEPSGKSASKQTAETNAEQPASGRSNSFLTALCLILAAAAGAAWLWLRHLQKTAY